MAASTARRKSSSLASVQFGPWFSASSSRYGRPSRAASARENVVLPFPLVPTTLIRRGTRPTLPLPRGARAREHRLLRGGAGRGGRAVDQRRRVGPRRVVLRRHRSVPVPRGRLLVRGGVHDGRAPDPRVAGARRPQPALACAAGQGGRAEPARRRVRGAVRPERLLL